MLTLLTFPAGFGDFSFSPFCTKVAYLLTLGGFEWRREDLSDPRKMPMGKLPVLRDGDSMIADSNAIRRYLEGLGADFDPGLTPLQRAQSHALIRMAEEHLYFLLLLDRWGNPAVWPEIRDAFFGSFPAPLRVAVGAMIRRDLMRGLHAQGIARFSEVERLERAERDLAVIREYLRHGPFLMGEAPTAADCAVVPILAGLRDGPVQTPLTRIVAQDAALSDHVDRMRAALPLPGVQRGGLNDDGA